MSLSFITKAEITIVMGWLMKISIAMFFKACVDPSAKAYIRAAKIVPNRKSLHEKKLCEISQRNLHLILLLNYRKGE